MVGMKKVPAKSIAPPNNFVANNDDHQIESGVNGGVAATTGAGTGQH